MPPLNHCGQRNGQASLSRPLGTPLWRGSVSFWMASGERFFSGHSIHDNEKLPVPYFPLPITSPAHVRSWFLDKVHWLWHSPGGGTAAVQRPETVSAPWTTDALSTTQGIPWSQEIINSKKTPLPFQGNYLHTRPLFCNFLQFCFCRERSLGAPSPSETGVFHRHRSSPFLHPQASTSVPASSPSCVLLFQNSRGSSGRFAITAPCPQIKKNISKCYTAI